MFFKTTKVLFKFVVIVTVATRSAYTSPGAVPALILGCAVGVHTHGDGQRGALQAVMFTCTKHLPVPTVLISLPLSLHIWRDIHHKNSSKGQDG